MFEPDFRPRAGAQIEERLLRSLQALFKDFTKVVGDIAKDYHEEYLLKRYLQDKWNELFPV